MDWSGPKTGPPDWTKTWIVSSDGGTAESSPQSGNTGHLDMEEEEETSEDEEEEIVPAVRKQDFLTAEQEPCAVQVTGALPSLLFKRLTSSLIISYLKGVS